MNILRDVGVKQYYVEFTDNGNGGYLSKVCRRKREIPYIDIALKYPTSEIDADGKYDISVRKEKGDRRHPTDIPEIKDEYVTPTVKTVQDTQTITKPIVKEIPPVSKQPQAQITKDKT